MVELELHMPLEAMKFHDFQCLFVCYVSITLLNGQLCDNNVTINSFVVRNGLMSLDRGRFVVVYVRSTLFLRH